MCVHTITDKADVLDKKLIFSKACLGEIMKRLYVLVDTGSSCNQMSRSLYKSLGLVVMKEGSEIYGFNGAASKVICVVSTKLQIGP